MGRRGKTGLGLAIVVGVVTAVSALGDSAVDAAQDNIRKATDTLTQIQRLVLAVNERRAQGSVEASPSESMPPPNVKGLVVLFSGKAEEIAQNWVKEGSGQPADWRVVDGAMMARGSSIVSKEKFTDFQLHVEFKVPYMPNAHGQARGNSGVGLQSMYEIQVLDSYGFKEPGAGDCGAVYNQVGPLVNACKRPLEWQSYDISFRAARWDANGKKVENARVTVFQNGILIQNNVEILKPTGIGGPESPNPGPVYLQYHGNDVQFRNVWVVPLPLEGPKHYEPR